MTKRGIGNDDRLQTFLDQLVANEEDVSELRLLAFGEVGDVGAIDDRRIRRRLARGARARAGTPP